MEQTSLIKHSCRECGAMLYDGANKRNATSPRTINGASKVDALCADLETLSVERFEILSLNVRLHLNQADDDCPRWQLGLCSDTSRGNAPSAGRRCRVPDSDSQPSERRLHAKRGGYRADAKHGRSS